MGVIQHDAVIAVTWKDEEVDRLKTFISSLHSREQVLFSINESVTNGYVTIFLAPDGSKEGWTESNAGDLLRERFISELRKSDYEDSSSPWDIAHVSFGELGNRFHKLEKAVA